MSILQQLGVKPFINAVGPFTAYGGAFLTKTVRNAMEEVSEQAVRLDHLQAAASKQIAQITHAEAAVVTTGAAAGLTLGTAACIAGYDVARMNKLPDTSHIPNEVIMPWHHITGYTHAIRAAGAKIIGVGLAKAFSAAHEQHIITPWEIEAKITDRTAAIAYTISEGNYPSLKEVTDLGRKYGVPVIVDAAPQVPPLENLHRFIDMGADLVCISGGKGICGPQASGILCGRKDLIASAALQMLDYGGSYETWTPPPSLIPKEKIRGIPERGIGRGMKVSKEAIVGLLEALEQLTKNNYPERVSRFMALIEIIKEHINGIEGVTSEVLALPHADPRLMITIDGSVVGKNAGEICHMLRQEEPIVYVGDMHTHKDMISVSPMNLSHNTADIVGQRLRTVIEK